MPAKPRWYSELPHIRRTLAAMDSPIIDRAVIERLFSIKRRQANYIMSKLGGYVSGSSVVIRREDLLLKLTDLAGSRGVPKAETQRKARVIEALNAVKSAPRPRRIPAPPPRRPRDPLPAGVSISAPGEMRIVFSSPETLLSTILGVVQSASADFANFAAGLEYSPSRNGVCTYAENEALESASLPPAVAVDTKEPL